MGTSSLEDVRQALVDRKILEPTGPVRFTPEFRDVLERAAKAGLVEGPRGHRRVSSAAELQVEEALRRFLPGIARTQLRDVHRSFLVAVHATTRSE